MTETLSDKIWLTLEEFRDDKKGNIKVEDVKKFIKDLKELDMGMFMSDGMFLEGMFHEEINKLAGEKLCVKQEIEE